MLEYPGDDFEEVFEQTFAISYQDVFGNTLTHDLKPGGADTPVTKQNRQVTSELLLFTIKRCAISCLLT